MELNNIETVEIEYRGFKGTMKTDMTWSEYSEMFELKSDTERGIYVISKMLVSWNLEDGGKPAEINTENIKRIDKEIGIFLTKKAEELMFKTLEKKKTSKSDSSSSLKE